MPVSSDDVKNASGLTASETKNLKDRSPEQHEQKIIEGIREVSNISGKYSVATDRYRLRSYTHANQAMYDKLNRYAHDALDS